MCCTRLYLKKECLYTNAPSLLIKQTANKNSLFMSRYWLLANQRPVFPDSISKRSVSVQPCFLSRLIPPFKTAARGKKEVSFKISHIMRILNIMYRAVPIAILSFNGLDQSWHLEGVVCSHRSNC